jgi:hypothetical protein
VKLGGTRSSDEEVDVFLVDAPPTATTTITLGDDTRRRRRWPELGLVAIGIAVVIGVGLLGGGDDDVAATPDPTTTVKHRPTTTTRPHRRTTTTQPSRFTTTTVRPTTTTTTWPQVAAGTGPLLPGPPTGTVVGVIGDDGIVTMIDLDTGNTCRNRVSSNGAWVPWNAQSFVGPLLVQTQGGSLAVGGMCDVAEVDASLTNGWLATSSETSFWVGGSSTTMIEYDIAALTPSGRELELPRFSGATVVAVGRDLVVSVSGELTFVDPSTDERRDLGTGTPLAGVGRTVAVSTCPELRCHLELVDVDTGQRRAVSAVQPATWYQAAFSHDGRQLLLSVPGDNEEQPDLAVVDVTTGKVIGLGHELQFAAFTLDDRWLIGNQMGSLVAIAVDGTGVNVHLDDVVRNVQGLAIVR